MPIWHRHRRELTLLSLSLIVALAAFLRLVDLGRADLGNLFYAASIRSMGQSWHNFFYAAFDPVATISVDKPPLALWLQVLSTKLLGFDGVAIILPIAIAGTIGVAVIFGAARRSHGIAAGLIAALVLAVFPESVATARDTTMDALIMLSLAAGAWLLIVCVEQRRPWLLVAFAALMGITFNIKFFEGFMILPAATLYVGWSYRRHWRSLLMPVAVGTIVGAIVSLSWVSFVDFTPADDRPLVMNDESNSAIGLALRYNGIERIIPADFTALQSITGTSGSQRGSAVSSAFGIGDAGPLRLIRRTNGALLGFGASLALGGLVITLIRRPDWFTAGPGILWGTWLVTGVSFFSASNRAPAHYTESYVPAIAVMAAVGLVEAWRATGPLLNRPGLRRIPGSLLLPALAFPLIAYAFVVYQGLPPMRTQANVLVAIGAFAILGLLAAVALPGRARLGIVARTTVVGSLVGVMLITSLWIALEAPRGGQITSPNPVDFAKASDRPNPAARQVPAEEILAYAEGVLPDARYRFAITGINDAGEAIAHTGSSVLPIWNNYLRIPVFTNDELTTLIREGQIPFALVEDELADTSTLAEIETVLAGECRPEPMPVTNTGWSLWNCTPQANLAPRS